MKGNRGITIIALIVTILIMLILAGISVAMLTGDNGMIKETIEAREDNKQGEEIEQIRASFSAVTMSFLKKADGRSYVVGADQLKKQLVYDVLHKDIPLEEATTESESGIKVTGDLSVEDGKLTVTMPSGKVYSVDVHGTTKLANE